VLAQGGFRYQIDFFAKSLFDLNRRIKPVISLWFRKANQEIYIAVGGGLTARKRSK